MDNTKDLMNTAMEHNRKLFSAVLKTKQQRALPATPTPAPTGLPSVALSLADRKAILDRQFNDRVNRLQKKYAGKITPKRMQELHAQAASNIAPGAGLSPSSGAIFRRALTGAMAAPTAGTLETSAPFMNPQ